MGKGYAALLAALALVTILLLSMYAAYIELLGEKERLAGELERTRRELAEATGSLRELREERRELQRRIGELEGEKGALQEKVRALEEKVSSLEANVSELQGEVNRLRGELAEAKWKARLYDEVLSPQPVYVNTRAVNATVTVFQSGGNMVFVVALKGLSGLGDGTPVYVALLQVGARVERVWSTLIFAGNRDAATLSFTVPRSEILLLRTVLYVGVAERAEGPVYIVSPPDVKVGPVEVDLHALPDKACMVIDARVSYTGVGKKFLYSVVAEIEPGGYTRSWTASLLILKQGLTYRLGGGVARCVKPGTVVVVALLPVVAPGAE